jgi:hypothetical protein
MKAYRPVFQDQVELSLADGLFIVLASHPQDAKNRVNRWLSKLDIRDKQYFTGCKYPQLYDVELYPMVEESVLIF